MFKASKMKSKINSHPFNYHNVLHIHSDLYMVRGKKKYFWYTIIYCKQKLKVLFLWALDITYELKEFQTNKHLYP